MRLCASFAALEGLVWLASAVPHVIGNGTGNGTESMICSSTAVEQTTPVVTESLAAPTVFTITITASAAGSLSETASSVFTAPSMSPSSGALTCVPSEGSHSVSQGTPDVSIPVTVTITESLTLSKTSWTTETTTVPLSPTDHSTCSDSQPSEPVFPCTVIYTISTEPSVSTPFTGTTTVTHPTLPAGCPWQTTTVTTSETFTFGPTVSPASPPGQYGSSSAMDSFLPPATVISYTLTPQGTSPAFTGVITVTPSVPAPTDSPVVTQPSLVTFTSTLATAPIVAVTVPFPSSLTFGAEDWTVTVTTPAETVTVIQTYSQSDGAPGSASDLQPDITASWPFSPCPEDSGSPTASINAVTYTVPAEYGAGPSSYTVTYTVQPSPASSEGCESSVSPSSSGAESGRPSQSPTVQFSVIGCGSSTSSSSCPETPILTVTPSEASGTPITITYTLGGSGSSLPNTGANTTAPAWLPTSTADIASPYGMGGLPTTSVSELTLSQTVPIGPGSSTVVEFTEQLTFTSSVSSVVVSLSYGSPTGLASPSLLTTSPSTSSSATPWQPDSSATSAEDSTVPSTGSIATETGSCVVSEVTIRPENPVPTEVSSWHLPPVFPTTTFGGYTFTLSNTGSGDTPSGYGDPAQTSVSYPPTNSWSLTSTGLPFSQSAPVYATPLANGATSNLPSIVVPSSAVFLTPVPEPTVTLATEPGIQLTLLPSAASPTMTAGTPSSSALNSTVTSEVATSSAAISSVSPSTVPAPACGGEGDRGTVALQFDDIPVVATGNVTDANSIKPQPVPFPYHRFSFSGDFHVVPPPATKYRPSSGSRMLLHNTSTSSVGQISLAELRGNPCFRFNFHSVSLGCNSTSAPCTFHITGLQWNGIEDVVRGNKTFGIAACSQQSNCTLSHLMIDSETAPTFANLTAINITLSTAGQPQTWWADDLRILWTDNSCSAAACRAMVPDKTVVLHRRDFANRPRWLLRWTARKQARGHF
ncbi:hypothetical protein VTK56DRAFT_5494 [Thermocarpiscus australiensis]